MKPIVHHIDIKRSWRLPVSERAAETMRRFTINTQMIHDKQHHIRLTFRQPETGICFINGPSGTGKTTLINELYRRTDPDQRLRLQDIDLPEDRMVIDCFNGTLLDDIRLLCDAGLGSITTYFKTPGQLSEGEKYRYRLAQALAGGKRILFADEFCSHMDAINAACIAHKLRRIVDQKNLLVYVAGSDDQLRDSLCPDVMIDLYLPGRIEVQICNMDTT